MINFNVYGGIHQILIFLFLNYSGNSEWKRQRLAGKEAESPHPANADRTERPAERPAERTERERLPERHERERVETRPEQPERPERPVEKADERQIIRMSQPQPTTPSKTTYLEPVSPPEPWPAR